MRQRIIRNRENFNSNVHRRQCLHAVKFLILSSYKFHNDYISILLTMLSDEFSSAAYAVVATAA